MMGWDGSEIDNKNCLMIQTWLADMYLVLQMANKAGRSTEKS